MCKIMTMNILGVKFQLSKYGWMGVCIACCVSHFLLFWVYFHLPLQKNIPSNVIMFQGFKGFCPLPILKENRVLYFIAASVTILLLN